MSRTPISFFPPKCSAHSFVPIKSAELWAELALQKPSSNTSAGPRRPHWPAHGGPDELCLMGTGLEKEIEASWPRHGAWRAQCVMICESAPSRAHSAVLIERVSPFASAQCNSYWRVSAAMRGRQGADSHINTHYDSDLNKDYDRTC